jgi:hypothetical protein
VKEVTEAPEATVLTQRNEETEIFSQRDTPVRLKPDTTDTRAGRNASNVDSFAKSSTR